MKMAGFLIGASCVLFIELAPQSQSVLRARVYKQQHLLARNHWSRSSLVSSSFGAGCQEALALKSIMATIRSQKSALGPYLSARDVQSRAREMQSARSTAVKLHGHLGQRYLT